MSESQVVLEVHGLRNLPQSDVDDSVFDGRDNIYVGDCTNGVRIWLGDYRKAVTLNIAQARILARQISASATRAQNAR